MEESSTVPLTFSFEAGVYRNAPERFPFWNLPSTRDWFKKRGYTLYDCLEDGIYVPALPGEENREARYPYASYDNEFLSKAESVPLLVDEATGKVAPAQDPSGRHVVINVVHANSDEYRILRFLSEQEFKTLEENCVLPVLELLANGSHWFAVMPRWGGDVYDPQFTRIYEAIDVIHCMLKGLAFLHRNNICHGDATLYNVVVNHFSDTRNTDYSRKRKELRLARRLSYAIIDFDRSFMLPSRDSRLPYYKSWGNFNLTKDTGTGEFDSDPFAFDVGGMGVIFCDEYQGLTGLVPYLAPLFDMMTTWDVRRRFTATQALEFFEVNVSELTDDQLNADISQHRRPEDDYRECDRWQDLTPDLVERWKMYKEIPEPWTRRVLRVICKRNYWYKIVPWTRWFCFQVFLEIPRRCYRWIFPSIIKL